MFLPQTDVGIPGILPLVFTRRTESGCAVGRFLGPSWTSTVDERLQIDAIGVVRVTADGLLIPYPHPAPGAPTTPSSVRGRTLLARDAEGIKGDSGAKALGGSPSDPGKPVTHEDVVEGRIPGKFGNLAPGVQIR
ncbi:hypothetical protein SUDANB1_02065 [Streptomyces sp. enrichment culture]